MSVQRETLRGVEKLIADGRCAEAVVQLEEMLNREPHNVDMLNDLGIALYNMEKWERSLEAFLQAIEVDPTRSVVWENLAELISNGTFSSDTLKTTYRRLTSDRATPPQRKALRQIGHRIPEIASHRAAYAQCNITPKSACVTQGWIGEEKAEKALAPLLLQALLLEDEAENRILILAADLFGIGDALQERVRYEARQWGIPPEAVMFNASHTHYAPGTLDHAVPSLGPYYEQYAEQIARAVREILAQLHDRLQPGLLYAGSAEAQIGVNQRWRGQNGTVHMEPDPNGYYHTKTPILALDLLDTQSTVTLVNHGCHPTGSGNPAFLSPGYPGYLRKKLTVDGVANGVMFLQGAAGSSKLALNGEGKTCFTNSPSEAEACAEKLATAVSESISTGLTSVRGSFFARIEQVKLSLEDPPSEKELQAIYDASQGPQQALEKEWAQHFLNGSDHKEEALALEIQLVGLGDDTGFITFQGEPTAELARRISETLEIAPHTFLLGYTNGLKAYLPTRQIVEGGGYEGKKAQRAYLLPSAFAPSVEEELLRGVEQLVAYWRAPNQPNGYGRYHLLEEQGRAFFCLSTGRCGTQTLAHLLSTASNARVYHHPRPYLVEETLAAYHGKIDRSQTFWRSRGGIIRDAWKDGLIFGETDHNMTAFASVINDDFEKAKFVVVVRNPWDFVRSGMRRQYYKNHSWDTGRLRPGRQHPDFEAWDRMSRFEKVCWLWKETYLRISNFIESLPPVKYHIIQFEELVENKEVTAELFEFLGLDGFDSDKIQRVLGKKLNRQKIGTYKRPKRWSKEKHDRLWDMCQHAVERLGMEEYRGMYRRYIEEAADGNVAEREASGAGSESEAPGLRPDDGEQPLISTTTIWDFKRFKYQAYPETISPADIIAPYDRKFLIDRAMPIASMGSCFARNVAKYLLGRGYNYLVTERPFRQASAHWEQVYNTACMRQIFEYSLTEDWEPIVRWWPKDDKVQDPFRRDILYPADACEEHFARHRDASRKAIQEARVIILTLGLIETWRDKRDQATYYRVPSPSIYDPDVHEFYVQTVQDCTQDLDVIHDLLAEANPGADIVVTVSPVPLFATFRMDVDVVSANRLSKSTLRVAAEYFAQKHDNVHYFPAYEIVTQGVDEPYEEDNRHVTKETIARVMQAFESLFAE